MLPVRARCVTRENPAAVAAIVRDGVLVLSLLASGGAAMAQPSPAATAS